MGPEVELVCPLVTDRKVQDFPLADEWTVKRSSWLVVQILRSKLDSLIARNL